MSTNDKLGKLIGFKNKNKLWIPVTGITKIVDVGVLGANLTSKTDNLI